MNVLDFLTGSKLESSAAAARLSRSLRVLEKGAGQCPTLLGTIRILKSRLRAGPSLGKRVSESRRELTGTRTDHICHRDDCRLTSRQSPFPSDST